MGASSTRAHDAIAAAFAATMATWHERLRCDSFHADCALPFANHFAFARLRVVALSSEWGVEGGGGDEGGTEGEPLAD